MDLESFLPTSDGQIGKLCILQNSNEEKASLWPQIQLLQRVAYFESPSSRDLTAVAPIITRFPNKPLVEGIVDAGLLPNRPPAAGAAVLVFVVPISPPVAGVVEAPPNRPPAEVVGVTDEEAAAF